MPKNKIIKISASHHTPDAMVNPTPSRKLPRYKGLRVKAYGPETASVLFLRICPEAHARIRIPKIETIAPARRVEGAGFAKIIKIIANKNPSGTRSRCKSLLFFETTEKILT